MHQSRNMNLGLFVLFLAVLQTRAILFAKSNRTNFCTKARAVLANTVSLQNGLLGLSVVTAITKSKNIFYMNNSAGHPTAGYIYNVQQTMAQRGGFKFKYILEPSAGSASYDQWLKNLTGSVDIVASSWYSDTTSRRENGMGFTQPVVDASLVLVSIQVPPKSPDLWLFASPFSIGLWLTIMALVAFNAILHYSIEPPEDRESFFKTCYISFGTFLGAESMSPGKPVTQLLNIGFTFFILIIVATYTANLAQIFISQQTIAPTIASIEDANSRKLPVCALAGTAAFTSIQSLYPQVNIQAVNSNSIVDLIAEMRSGQCEGVVMGQCDWDLAQVDINSNAKCDLMLVQGGILPISGAWVYKQDYSVYCTSFVQTVFDNLIVAMKADGTLDALRQAAIGGATTVTCTQSFNPDQAPTEFTLSLYQMSGVFVCYCVMACLAVMLWGVRKIKKYMITKNMLWYKKAPNSDEEAVDVKNQVLWNDVLDLHLRKQVHSCGFDFDIVADKMVAAAVAEATLPELYTACSKPELYTAQECRLRWAELDAADLKAVHEKAAAGTEGSETDKQIGIWQTEKEALIAEVDKLRDQTRDNHNAAVDLDSEAVQAYMAELLSNAVSSISAPMLQEVETLSVQIHEQSRKKEQLETLLRDERSASEQRRSKQTQEEQSLQSAVDQAQATASAGPVDESVYTEKIQSAMQQLYLQAGEVFVPAGEDSAHFDGSEVMSKIRALLRTAVTGGNGSPSRKG